MVVVSDCVDGVNSEHSDINESLNFNVLQYVIEVDVVMVSLQ